MKKILALVMAGWWVWTLTGCGPSEDPEVRLGNLFFKNKQYDSAYQAYEKAVAKNAKNLDLVRANFKNSYYYYGGQLEMSDSADSAIKYYEKGFALEPSDVGMCNKLAMHYWDKKDYAGAERYLVRLAQLDAEAPDSDKKAALVGEDYYNAGYAQYQSGKYAEAVDSFKNSLKAAPKGKKAGKCKEALGAAQDKLNKK